MSTAGHWLHVLGGLVAIAFAVVDLGWRTVAVVCAVSWLVVMLVAALVPDNAAPFVVLAGVVMVAWFVRRHRKRTDTTRSEPGKAR